MLLRQRRWVAYVVECGCEQLHSPRFCQWHTQPGVNRWNHRVTEHAEPNTTGPVDDVRVSKAKQTKHGTEGVRSG